MLLEKVIVRRKKVSDIQQAKDAFASRLVAVRNMLTSPCGMPTLDNKRPTCTRDKGPVRFVPFVEHNGFLNAFLYSDLSQSRC